MRREIISGDGKVQSVRGSGSKRSRIEFADVRKLILDVRFLSGSLTPSSWQPINTVPKKVDGKSPSRAVVSVCILLRLLSVVS
jgi:hypothetical protein